ncbi:lyase family protein [Pontixanthobacter aestiaquae]|uniref:lyase family protein n=1 Tax=Pontixanthobacter aestiaquae TaxID=1509367 RepID=UPI002E2693A7
MASTCSSREVADLFAYEARTQTVLDIEAAMARAQAEHGHIPKSAAEEITRQARAELVTEADFSEEYSTVRHRMVALLNVWRRSLSAEASQYVHYGATTVDIYDTATIMQINASIENIDACLAGAIDAMSELALAHKSTVMIGRTLGQHAQPITFGKKVSVWIGEYDRHRDRLSDLRERVMRSAILKGAVGDYSGLGPKAIAIEKSFARELGFAKPYTADWHGTRDVIAEYGMVLSLIAKTHARIGQEIFLLQSTDIGEVRESLPEDVVGSSSMPHKRNPIVPERLIHAGRTIPRLAEVLGDDQVNFYERDNTSRLSPIVEDISVQSATAARSLTRLIGSLEVDAEAMRRNIDRTSGYAMSQRVAFALAEHMPRTEAEALVKQIIRFSAEQGIDFEEALNTATEVNMYLHPTDITALLDPTQLDQQAIAQVEAVVADAAPKPTE